MIEETPGKANKLLLTESLFTPTSSEKNLIAKKWKEKFDSMTETDMQLIVQSPGLYFIFLINSYTSTF